MKFHSCFPWVVTAPISNLGPDKSEKQAAAAINRRRAQADLVDMVGLMLPYSVFMSPTFSSSS